MAYRTRLDESKVIELRFPSFKILSNYKGIIQFILGLVLLLFCFNFFIIKCEGQSLINVSGLNLVIGTNVSKELSESLKNIEDLKSFDANGNMAADPYFYIKDTEAKLPPNFFAVLCFTLLITSIVFLFFKARWINILTLILVAMAFLSLIVVSLSFKTYILQIFNNELDLVISLSFFYWTALVLLFLGLLLLYVRWKNDL